MNNYVDTAVKCNLFILNCLSQFERAPNGHNLSQDRHGLVLPRLHQAIVHRPLLLCRLDVDVLTVIRKSPAMTPTSFLVPLRMQQDLVMVKMRGTSSTFRRIL